MGFFSKNKPCSNIGLDEMLFLVVIAARGFLAWVNELSANAVAVRVKTDLRERLFAHILALGPAYSRD